MSRLRHSLLAVLLAISPFAAAQTVWDGEGMIQRQEGSYQITSIKGAQESAFQSLVQDTTAGAIASFEGACSDSMSTQVYLSDGSAIMAYSSSGQYDDLNAGLITRAIAQELAAHCPSMTELSIVLNNMPDTPTVAKLSRASNWAPMAPDVGDGPDSINTEPRVSLASQDPFTGITVQANVACANVGRVPLGWNGANSRRGPPRLSAYKAMAVGVAEEYRSACPKAEAVQFIVSSLPDRVVCESQDAGGCYILATWVPGSAPATDRQSAVASWSLDYIGYDADAPSANQINTFDDMVAAMRADYMSMIRESYSGYFRLFHNEFLLVYSEQCAAQIEDPVQFEVSLVERTIDGNGFTVSEETSAPYRLTLDRRFEQTYLAYEDANRARLVARMFSLENLGRAGGSGGAGPSRVIGEVIADRRRLERFVAKGCASEAVQDVYTKLPSVLEGR